MRCLIFFVLPPEPEWRGLTWAPDGQPWAPEGHEWAPFPVSHDTSILLGWANFMDYDDADDVFTANFAVGGSLPTNSKSSISWWWSSLWWWWRWREWRPGWKWIGPNFRPHWWHRSTAGVWQKMRSRFIQPSNVIFLPRFKRRRQYRPPPSIGQEGRGKISCQVDIEKCSLGISFLCSVIISLSTFYHPKSGLEIKIGASLTLMLDWLTTRRRMASIQGTSIFFITRWFSGLKISHFQSFFSFWCV